MYTLKEDWIQFCLTTKQSKCHLLLELFRSCVMIYWNHYIQVRFVVKFSLTAQTSRPGVMLAKFEHNNLTPTVKNGVLDYPIISLLGDVFMKWIEKLRSALVLAKVCHFGLQLINLSQETFPSTLFKQTTSYFQSIEACIHVYDAEGLFDTLRFL